jgi:hypothetical protein
LSRKEGLMMVVTQSRDGQVLAAYAERQAVRVSRSLFGELRKALRRVQQEAGRPLV